MKTKIEKPNIREDARSLRKKTKRIEESRSLIKAKHREKGKVIKEYQDRQTELEQNRDHWKMKFRQEEIDRMELADKYKHIASLFEMKEEQLREILEKFEQSKKKYPQIPQRAKKLSR